MESIRNLIATAPRRTPAPAEVRVEAPARLHLGFLDLNGAIGRRFGSVGLTLEGLATRLALSPCDQLRVEGPEAARIAPWVARLAERLDVPATGAITVEEAVPAHAGLGSGTQLAIALGVGFARLHGRELSARSAARLLERGGRSGIGIGAFEGGGFLLDGGRGDRAEPPPLIARLPFPEAWRVLLILDEGAGAGLHGSREAAAFRQLPPFPEAAAGELCRLMLMQALPALAEQEIAPFGAAITRLQAVVGDHFAPAQGGRFASRPVAAALDWCEAQGAAGVGQSSWGPTGFALLESEAAGAALRERAVERFAGAGLRFHLCRARNQGGVVAVAPADRALQVSA